MSIKKGMENIKRLKTENGELEEQINTMEKELNSLKELFITHARDSHSVNIMNHDLSKLLKDNTDIDIDESVKNLLQLSQKKKKLILQTNTSNPKLLFLSDKYVFGKIVTEKS